MINPTFKKFFYVGQIEIGPTITSLYPQGDWLGRITIHPTKNNIFLKNEKTIVAIREFENILSDDFYNALTYLSISKSDFDSFANSLFIAEWEKSDLKIKPNISQLKKRKYL